MKLIINKKETSPLNATDMTETIRIDQTMGLVKELTIRFDEAFSALELSLAKETIASMDLYDASGKLVSSITDNIELVSINKTTNDMGTSTYSMFKRKFTEV